MEPRSSLEQWTSADQIVLRLNGKRGSDCNTWFGRKETRAHKVGGVWRLIDEWVLDGGEVEDSTSGKKN